MVKGVEVRVKRVEVGVKPMVVWVKAMMGEVKDVVDEVKEVVGEVKEVVRKTQEYVVANMNDKGEIGFRLGDIEAEDNYRSMGVGIVEKEQTITSSAELQNLVHNLQLNQKPQRKDPKGNVQLLVKNFH
ncbi:hypothetical protein Tco_1484320 [Tanacetum coccineum]